MTSIGGLLASAPEIFAGAWILAWPAGSGLLRQTIRATIGLLATLSAMGLALFSRLTPDDIEAQATRAQLRKLVHEHPGISLTEIANTTRLGWGTLVYHLNRLEAA